jgi:hypothetical protein
MKLTLGFSPCPNDTFIFDALVNKKIGSEGLDRLPTGNLTVPTLYRYRAVVQNGKCSPEFSTEATVNVEEGAFSVSIITPIGTPFGPTICAGTPLVLTANASGGGGNYSYVWKSGQTTLGSAQTLTVSPNSTTLYSVTVTDTVSGTEVFVSVQVHVQPQVSISSQPRDYDACPGGRADFSVTTTDASSTYQWKKDGVDLANGPNVTGAKTATLTLNNVSATDEGGYTVVVTGLCPTPATSLVAALKLKNDVAILTQPESQTVCLGGNASFSVNASGVGLTYQWRQVVLGVPQDIPGATGATLALNAVHKADEGTYTVKVTGSCGSVESIPVSLTVGDALKILTQPAGEYDPEKSKEGECHYSQREIQRVF